jgi:hypothetical protein
VPRRWTSQFACKGKREFARLVVEKPEERQAEGNKQKGETKENRREGRCMYVCIVWDYYVSQRTKGATSSSSKVDDKVMKTGVGGERWDVWRR